jgi:peptide/nickel transport system substrate-binding protein/oligopeptide transport system substrate-binding protein
MRGAKSAKWVAGAIVVALSATACGGGGSDSGDNKAGGQVKVQIGEPQHGLVPSNTYETEGAEVIHALFTGLVQFDEDGNTKLANAKSIETDDQQHWTIKLKDGWKFHDGTPVTAQSYADAWNYAANQKNAQETNPLFSKIEGYKDLSPGPGKEPTADKMSGLKVVDDTTLKVTLNTPFSAFKTMLGFTGFAPLPKVFFDDPKAFGQKPVGNGPFKMVGKFQHNDQIKTTKFKDYALADKIEVTGVTFKIYQKQETAWKDLQAGGVDIMDTLPPSALGSAKQVLGDRYVTGNDSGIGYIGFPIQYNKAFQNVDLRHAISMAIDRQAINKAIYSGSRPPADDFISPVVPGYRKGACGEFCTFNPKKAKKLYEKSGGLPNDTMELGYNADGGHKAWITAAANQIEKALDIKVKVKPFEQFGAILDALGDKKYQGAFRMGWIMDYPNMENYLRPIFSKSAIENGSNYAGYVNPKVEDLLDKADAAPPEKAIKLYQKADDIIIQDMPYIPVSFYKRNAGFSKNLSQVKFTADLQVDWTSVKYA